MRCVCSCISYIILPQVDNQSDADFSRVDVSLQREIKLQSSIGRIKYSNKEICKVSSESEWGVASGFKTSWCVSRTFEHFGMHESIMRVGGAKAKVGHDVGAGGCPAGSYYSYQAALAGS